MATADYTVSIETPRAVAEKLNALLAHVRNLDALDNGDVDPLLDAAMELQGAINEVEHAEPKRAFIFERLDRPY